MTQDNPDLEAAERKVRAAYRAVREARHKCETGGILAPDEPPLCSFCGTGQNNVERMVAGGITNGDRAHVCNRCITAFYTSHNEEK